MLSLRESAFLKFLVGILVVFSPIKAAAGTAVLLVFFDLITGVLAAKRRGESVTSSGLKRTIIKLALYLFVISLGFLTQQFLTGPTVPISNMINSLVGLTELTSILENVNMNGLFSSLVNKLNQEK